MMVRNDRRTKLAWKIVLGQLFVIGIIAFFSLSVIGYAEGYRFDYDNMRVFRTGVLYLDFLPKDANVFINNSYFDMSAGTAKNLVPGNYDIEIRRSGYLSWHQPLNIQKKSVNVYKKIVLFRENIEISNLTDPKKISLIKSSSEIFTQKGDNGLNYSSNEIWVKDKLITRFSVPIQKVIWYSDAEHLVFQQGDEINVIDLNGSNNTLLVKLTGAKYAQFALNDSGTELYYVDGDQYKMAKIR